MKMPSRLNLAHQTLKLQDTSAIIKIWFNLSQREGLQEEERRQLFRRGEPLGYDPQTKKRKEVKEELKRKRKRKWLGRGGTKLGNSKEKKALSFRLTLIRVLETKRSYA